MTDHIITTDSSGVLTFVQPTFYTPICWESLSFYNIWEYVFLHLFYLSSFVYILLVVYFCCVYVKQFVNDEDNVPYSWIITKLFKAKDPIEERGFSFGCSQIIIFLAYACLVAAISLWPATIPIGIIMITMIFARYIVRMKKKIDKINEAKEIL